MNRLIEWWQAVSEPASSEDFGKPLDEWRAAKIAKGELGAPRAWLPRLIVAVAALVLVIVLAVLLTSCSGICGNHGGIREYIGNNIYVCNDGTVT